MKLTPSRRSWSLHQLDCTKQNGKTPFPSLSALSSCLTIRVSEGLVLSANSWPLQEAQNLNSVVVQLSQRYIT